MNFSTADDSKRAKSENRARTTRNRGTMLNQPIPDGDVHVSSMTPKIRMPIPSLEAASSKKQNSHFANRSRPSSTDNISSKILKTPSLKKPEHKPTGSYSVPPRSNSMRQNSRNRSTSTHGSALQQKRQKSAGLGLGTAQMAEEANEDAAKTQNVQIDDKTSRHNTGNDQDPKTSSM